MSSVEEYGQLTGVQKAAILLTMLDDAAASAIVRHLPEDDVQRVAREISHLGRVPTAISQQVLEEYRRMSQARDYVTAGGRERRAFAGWRSCGSFRRRSRSGSRPPSSGDFAPLAM